MEPIIDPMVFYWISVASKIGAALMGLGIAVVSAGAVCMFIFLLVYDDCFDVKPEHRKALARCAKLSALVGPFLILISLFVPSKDTCLQMLVASQVTPQNIDALKGISGDVRETVKQDVLDIIKQIKDGQEKPEK